MDEDRSKAVVKVFCDLYEKGLIYRGLRMVNWDPVNRTAISDDEVFFVDEKSKLYYLRYYVADDDFTGETGAEEGWCIATSRDAGMLLSQQPVPRQ